jgi:hypothetical protein
MAVVCYCSVPTFCTAEDEEGERWHRDYWEDVDRFKRVTNSLCTTCFASHYYFICENIGLPLILFGATNHTQVLFFSTLFRFILVFTNVSDVHWRGSTICASENNSWIGTNIFAVSVFPSVCHAVMPCGKRWFAWHCRWYGGEGSKKICRPGNFDWNRKKLTVCVLE